MNRNLLSRLIAPALCAVLIAPVAAGVNSADDALIRRIEAYLNGITTLRADFLQVNHDGSISEGVLSIARPGRMRIEYAPPLQIEIVTDGEWITYIDRELGQISQAPLNGTHAELFVKENIRLDESLKVIAIEPDAAAVRVTLARRNEPGEGTLTLVFSDRPLDLRQWIVKDPQGLITRVTLMNVEFGVELDPALFAAPAPFPENQQRR